MGQALTALLMLVVAVALSSGYLSKEHAGSWWLLIVTAGLQGIVSGFTQPALISIIPEIVNEQQVMNAISLHTMLSTVFRLIGPAVGGFFVDIYGFAFVYYLISGLYAVSAGLLFFSQKPASRLLTSPLLCGMLERDLST